MKKSLLAIATLAAAGAIPMGRAYTKDIAFTYRMGGGIPGDINRSHPASVLPVLQDATNPVKLYGLAAVWDAANNTARQVLAADQGATINLAGMLARDYPTQQASGGSSAAFGAATPPVTGPLSLLRQGFMIVLASDFVAHAPIKGQAVYVWTAVSSGNHVQGGLESFNTAGSTTLVNNARWASPPDSAGNCEVEVWAA